MYTSLSWLGYNDPLMSENFFGWSDGRLPCGEKKELKTAPKELNPRDAYVTRLTASSPVSKQRGESQPLHCTGV